MRLKLAVLLLIVASFLTTGCLQRNDEDVANGENIETSQEEVQADEDLQEETYSVTEFSDAIIENDSEKVEKILESGFDPNQKDEYGMYPIENALAFDNVEMAERLLESGADMEVSTAEGISIYEFVMSGKNQAMKELFEKYK